MASSRANHPLHPPFFVASRNIPKDLFPRASFRLFRVVITAKYFRKSTLPSYYFSKKGFTCIHVYIYIYTGIYLYLYIDVGERGCVRVHKRKSSRAISAITSASAQTLPFFRRHWRSSLCLVSSSVSDIFFPLPPIFSSSSFFSFFFLYHPHFYSFLFNSDKITAPRQFSLRKYPNDSALMILIIDKYLYDIHLWIHRMMFKVI